MLTSMQKSFRWEYSKLESNFTPEKMNPPPNTSEYVVLVCQTLEFDTLAEGKRGKVSLLRDWGTGVVPSFPVDFLENRLEKEGESRM